MIVGLKVRTPDSCVCDSEIAVIDGNHHLYCSGCNRRRGFLTPLVPIWLEAVANKFGGLENITLKHSARYRAEQ